MGSLANVLAGLGSTQSIIAPINTTISAAGSVAGGLVAAGTISLPGVASAAVAVPIIGAAVAGVTLLIGIWLNGIAKHNAEKAATTAIVNQAEPFLKQNVAAFLSLDAPTQSDQAQALANFDNIWQQVVAACENGGQYEDAGQRCVGDRSAGGQWDWFSYYRDPIATATNVVPDPIASVAGISSLFAGLSSGGAGSLLLPALLIGAVLLLSSD